MSIHLKNKIKQTQSPSPQLVSVAHAEGTAAGVGHSLDVHLEPTVHKALCWEVRARLCCLFVDTMILLDFIIFPQGSREHGLGLA